MNKINLLILLFYISFPNILHTQEALKSAEEEYYDFLLLQGLTERPALNYRTLSDSKWSIDEDTSHLWQGQNLGTWHSLFGDFRMRVYGPELFMSGNTAAPYGQNDGVLWQGRGFNALFKGGVRFEGYGIELTILPHLAFSQNADFDIMPSHYENEYGYFWGYDKPKSKKGGADVPQRFGGKPFFDWDFGDSEIRYTWKTLTIGFGMQAIWLGPSHINPLLHSNNAPAYPKFDIGLRRQKVTLPWLGWYIGDVEVRLWLGLLTESDYFDSDDSNNYTMIHGLAFAYAPSFLPGLTLFFNWTSLNPWEIEYSYKIIPLFIMDFEDQKVSVGLSWLFQKAGLEIYGELGRDDFVPVAELNTALVSYPFHSMTYSVGIKKHLTLSADLDIHGEIIFEWNHMEMSQDFQFQWSYSLYFHHELIHGYTNRGQLLGSGNGVGGNSQYLGFKVYYPKGSSLFFIHRNNPDNNFLYSKAIYAAAEGRNLEYQYFHAWKANLNIGITTNYYILKNLSLGGGIVYNLICNPYYFMYKENPSIPDFIHNVSITMTAQYRF